MSKKLSIIIFVLFLILGGIFGYLYFNSKSSAPVATTTDNTGGSGGGFPTSQPIEGNTGGRAQNSANGSTTQFQNPDTTFGGNQPKNSSLRQIVNVPVAGATSYVDNRGQVVVRYLERETGHVQDQPIQEKVPQKVTDTTVPKIFDALFGKDGKFLVFQSLVGKSNQLSTAFAEIKKTPPPVKTATSTTLIGEDNLSTTVGTLDGALLPGTVHFVALSPDKTAYLYLNESSAGSLGVLIPGDKTKLEKSLTTVFTSKLTEWMPDWPAKDITTFTTRAGSGLAGSMYRINNATKQKTALLSGVLGLTAKMSGDGTRVLYAEASGSGFIPHMLDTKTQAVANFSLRTLPEKCVWSKKTFSVVYCAVPSYVPAGAYPDDWYVGQMSFNDAIWKINTATGETNMLASAANNRTDSLDAYKLFYDDAEKNLFWINKKDSTVWTVAL